MSRVILYLGIITSLTACVPASDFESFVESSKNVDQHNFEFKEGTPESYDSLIEQFFDVFVEQDITLNSGQAYLYDGKDPNAFIAATNQFYKINQGYCPLEQAFYVANSGTVFLTLTGDGQTSIRAYIYDHSRKPKLNYVYAEGTSTVNKSTKICETALGL